MLLNRRASVFLKSLWLVALYSRFPRSVRARRALPGGGRGPGTAFFAGLFFAPLVLIALPACGGVDPQLSKSQVPIWRPAEYFTGAKIGYRTIYDRNGNVRETARIERECDPRPADQAGVCRDRIDYGYTTPDTEDTTRWSIFYITDQESRVSYSDGFGTLAGETLGSMMVLSGDRRLPGSVPAAPAAEEREPGGGQPPVAADGETATVELRLHLRPGPRRPMLQSELYSFLGVEIGRSDTLWLDR